MGIHKDTFQAISYDGENGIESILKMLCKRGWKETLDQDRLIGVTRQGSAITLEPGGQLELSGQPHRTLLTLEKECSDHLEELETISTPLGIEWLHMGLQPLTTLKAMSWVPKSRYRIMKEYYKSRSLSALEMMALTSSIQLNLDYLDEKDARRKVHIGAALGPVIGAMFANAPIEEGQFNGYCSRRLAIWRKMDADRCGIRHFFVDGTFTFEKYRDFALGAPMYFVVRNQEYVSHTHHTFQDFMQEKKENHIPTLGDWDLHLTTLFPDVRLKDHLEFRTTDSNEPPLAMALCAFWLGALYDPGIVDQIQQRISDFTYDEIVKAMDDAAMHGLQSKIGREPILQVARDVVHLAAMGLSRLDRIGGRYDIRYLEPLRELLEKKMSPAEELKKSWNGKLSSLLKRKQKK